MRIVILSLLTIVLAACSQTETTTISSTIPQTEGANVDQQFVETYENANALTLFLQEDLSTMTYSSESGTATLNTIWLSNDEVNATWTSPFTEQQFTYLIQPYNILLNDELYLQNPINQTVNDWHYVETLPQLETPYATFEQVVVLRNENVATTHYIAPQFGIVQIDIEENGKATTYQLQTIQY